jgi:hypothetical protein
MSDLFYKLIVDMVKSTRKQPRENHEFFFALENTYNFNKKVLYEFNYLPVCLYIYLFKYIFVTCSSLEKKLSQSSKI